jgi:hypothetical protein
LLLIKNKRRKKSRIMKQITLNVDESKFKAFLSFIKTLDYVSVSDETAISLEQQQEVNRRLKLIEEGKMKTRSWTEAKEDLFKR